MFITGAPPPPPKRSICDERSLREVCEMHLFIEICSGQTLGDLRVHIARMASNAVGCRLIDTSEYCVAGCSLLNICVYFGPALTKVSKGSSTAASCISSGALLIELPLHLS